MRTTLITACVLLVAVAAIPGTANADHTPCIEERGKGHWPGPDSHGRFNPDECFDGPIVIGPDLCAVLEAYVSC